jgi:ribosomal protein S14
MTTSDHKKVFKQLEKKPVKLAKFKKHNEPKKRTTGVAQNKCKICGTHRAIIRKYTLNLCRRCFRERAQDVGFKKYD